MLGTKAIASAIFVFFAALYVRTMCPTIYTMDCGELILAANKLEIAHPTGYPLFCILGKISACVIPFGSIAWRINAMNALFAAATVAVLFLAISEVARKYTATFVAALFAISPLFWDVAGYAEVHALSSLLVSVELFLFLRWRRVGNSQLLYWLAFTAGLAMTNHLSSALILPGILFGVLQRDRSLIRNLAFVLRSFALFVIPLSLYLYLPLRAGATWDHMWGDVYAETGFIAYVTGQWFRSRMFSMMPVEVWQRGLRFLGLVVDSFPIWVAWTIPLGAVLIRRRKAGPLGALLIMALLNVAYNINYKIPDIEPYFVPTMLVLSICLAVGLEFLIERLRNGPVKFAALVALPVILLVLIVSGLQRSDKHDAWFITDYANNVLKTPAKDSLVIACGDSCFNALRYAQEVNGDRPDLIIAHREIMRAWGRAKGEWVSKRYYDAISERSPAMRKFRWPSKYGRTDMISERLLADVIAETVKERAVYIICIGNDYESHPIMARIKDDFRLLPEGMLFRIYPKSHMVDPAKLAQRSEKLWETYETRRIYDGSIKGGELEREVPDRYAVFHIALADLELRAGMYADATENFQKALAINPALLKARNGLGVALACQGDYREAAKEWKTVLVHKPDDDTAARGLRMIEASKEQQ